MNNLQKILKIRGITITQMCAEIGLSYHPAQKTITGIRKPRHVREKIAAYLGIEYDHLWGPLSEHFTQKHLLSEIKKRANAEQERLRGIYLPKK